MCDMILARGGATRPGRTLFGKNSDRQRNEAQTIELHPARRNARGERLRCTYIDIPQVAETAEVLICRPYWIWGAEMGVNAHSVVIGNEGLRSRFPAPTEAALTGMDLVRLGLERAASARGAVEVITSLLAEHGQGGNCGHLVAAHYNNSFLIVDPHEAFVVETVGRDWIVAAAPDRCGISNRYAIQGPPLHASHGIAPLLRTGGWDGEGLPDYAALLGHPNASHIGSAFERAARSGELLGSVALPVEPIDFFQILRDHGTDTHAGWHPHDTGTRAICMHAGADDPSGQTVQSLVVDIGARQPILWFTAVAAPCISLFKPWTFGTPLPPGLEADRTYDPGSRWWAHERWHRELLLRDFGGFRHAIAGQQHRCEKAMLGRIDAGQRAGDDELANAFTTCWVEADSLEAAWRAGPTLPRAGNHIAYDREWARLSEAAGLSLPASQLDPAS